MWTEQVRRRGVGHDLADLAADELGGQLAGPVSGREVVEALIGTVETACVPLALEDALGLLRGDLEGAGVALFLTQLGQLFRFMGRLEAPFPDARRAEARRPGGGGPCGTHNHLRLTASCGAGT
jgi:hypothetical protein